MTHPNPPNPDEPIRFRKTNRTNLRSASFRKLLPEDHVVFVIDQFVQTIDFSELWNRIRAREHHPGAPVIDPRILFAVWFYACLKGISSAHRVADLCRTDVAFLWLCGQTHPNYHTLSTFYSDNAEFLRSVFLDHLEILKKHDLIPLTEITLDGRKIPAHASKESFHREPTLTQHRAEAEAHLAQWEAQRAAEPELSARQEAARSRAKRERVERVKAAITMVRQRQVERSENRRNTRAKPAETRASETDPDARKMKMTHGGYTPAYNVQTVTDTMHQLIVAVEVVDQACDNGLLQPMMDQVEEGVGHAPGRILVDAGFVSNEDIDHFESQGIPIFMPPKNVRKEKKAGRDPYARKRRDTDAVARWRARMGTDEGSAVYARRAPVAEGVHAQQWNRGWRRFRLRGIEKVRTESIWQAIIHNFCVLRSKNLLDRLLPRANSN